jgi:hypothetical protein
MYIYFPLHNKKGARAHDKSSDLAMTTGLGVIGIHFFERAFKRTGLNTTTGTIFRQAIV